MIDKADVAKDAKEKPREGYASKLRRAARGFDKQKTVYKPIITKNSGKSDKIFEFADFSVEKVDKGRATGATVRSLGYPA